MEHAGRTTGTTELDSMAQDWAASTAQDLTAQHGFTAARAEQSTVTAQRGRLTIITTATVSPGSPGQREKMLDLYAAMVVRSLIEQEKSSGR